VRTLTPNFSVVAFKMWSYRRQIANIAKIDGRPLSVASMLYFANVFFIFSYLFLWPPNRASAYGTPLDGATVKVVITTVNKT